jgi:hypothetical protein
MDEEATKSSEDQQEQKGRKVWILVDHSSREEALLPVASQLESRGLTVELVTITEVIGSVAREAIAGGAERLLRGLRVAARGKSGDEDLVGAIRRRQPDVLVVTEARYVRAIGVMENLTGVESLQVGLLSDFHVDPAWFNGQLHAFIVPDEGVGAQIVGRGFDEERVQVAGPAVRPNFHDDVDRQKARQELGLDGDDTIILVRADGFNTATLEKLVFQCTLSEEKVRFVFHYDGDGATASTLRRAADQYGLPAAMFGRVKDLERYFAAVDGVLADQRDTYLPELLQSQVPTLLLGDGESDGNGAALETKGLVDFLDDLGQLGTRLDRFAAAERRQELTEKLEEWDGLKRHKGLSDALAKAAKNAEKWQQRPSPMAEGDADEGSEAADTEKGEAPSAAFESIGTPPSKDDQRDGVAGKEGGSPKEAPPERRRDYSTLSRAEAKEQLAELILKERDLERRLKDLERQQERWRGRLQLAREWNEEDLAEEAETILRGYVADADPLEEQLADIRRQKEKLKQAARRGRGDAGTAGAAEGAGDEDRGSGMEERFRKMEIDSDLEGLKDRIRRELGE